MRIANEHWETVTWCAVDYFYKKKSRGAEEEEPLWLLKSICNIYSYSPGSNSRPEQFDLKYQIHPKKFNITLKQNIKSQHKSTQFP